MLKILCIVRRAKPPPPPLSPASAADQQHLPTFTTSYRSRGLQKTTSKFKRRKSAKKSAQSGPGEPQLTQNCAPGELLDPHRVARSSKNQQKPKAKFGFYDVHKIALGCLRDALFAPRGPQMSPQVAKRRAKGPKRSPLGTQCSVVFLLFFGHGCQMGSGRVPERPPTPQNNENSI